MIRKAVTTAAGFISEPITSGQTGDPGTSGSPAGHCGRRSHSDRGLATTALVPGDRARRSGPRLPAARRWSYPPSLGNGFGPSGDPDHLAALSGPERTVRQT